MPSHPHAPASPSDPITHPLPPGEAPASPAQQLAQASRALWLATLALMTAVIQTPAKRRYLLARRSLRFFP
jgi:hypothetical protein